MHIALFIFYGILCGYGILKMPFCRRSGIRPAVLLSFFAIHVFAGCLHNIIAWRFYPAHGDIWDSFRWGLLLRDWLHNDFQRFLAANSRWTYFTHNGINFIQLLLNFLSFDNLYINTLLFSFPVFLGNVALFLVFRRHFPGGLLSAVIVFMLPSTLFWTACVFREGVLYMLLGVFFYQLDPLLYPDPPDARRQTLRHSPGARNRAAVWLCCWYALLLYFRFEVAIFLLPALLTMYWIRYPSRSLSLVMGAAALAALITILAIPGISSWFLSGLARWQSRFQTLEGHSRLFLPAMDGSWSGLFRTAPYAFLNGLFQPLPGAGGRAIYLVFSIELIFIWIIVAVALIRSFTTRYTPTRDGFPIACIVFAGLGMLAVGAMVPFAGAIVRYRSIYLPFLLAPALHSLRDSPIFGRVNRWLVNKL